MKKNNNNKYYKIKCYKCGKISYFNLNDEFCGNREGGLYYYVVCPNCGQVITTYMKSSCVNIDYRDWCEELNEIPKNETEKIDKKEIKLLFDSSENLVAPNDYLLVGKLASNKEFDVFLNGKNNNFYLAEINNPNSLRPFPWSQRVTLLTSTWDETHYYKDGWGIHFYNFVYDCLWIDIWADTFEDLIGLILKMIKPPNQIAEKLEELKSLEN